MLEIKAVPSEPCIKSTHGSLNRRLLNLRRSPKYLGQSLKFQQKNKYKNRFFYNKLISSKLAKKLKDTVSIICIAVAGIIIICDFLITYFPLTVIENNEARFEIKQDLHLSKFEDSESSLIHFISMLIEKYSPNSTAAVELATDIVKISKAQEINPIYVASIIAAESSFRANARSKVGAMGLMQLRPKTADYVVRKIRLLSDPINKYGIELNDPRTNILLGINYLKYLQAKYRGDDYLALAAYNWGPGNLKRAMANDRQIPRSVRSYAEKIIKNKNLWERNYLNFNESQLKVQGI